MGLFGKHHSIERFGLEFLSLFLAFVLLIVSIVVKKTVYDSKISKGRVLYTSGVVFSLSGITGSVQDVVVSKDHTKAYVQLHLNDTSTISIDAKDYMAFLTGSKANSRQDELKSNPTGQIYIFGTTGDVGIFLDNKGMVWPNQIMNLTLRCMKSYANPGQSVVQSNDKSFSEYDQLSLYFNPGGLKAQTVAALDGDTIDIKGLYYETAIAYQEAKIKGKLFTDLSDMEYYKQLSKEYETRLTSGTDSNGESITIPALPSSVKDDDLYAVSVDGKKLAYSLDNKGWVSEDNVLYDSEYYELYLNTPRVYDDCVDFQWQGGSIKSGYIESVLGDQDPKVYLEDLAKYTKSADEALKSDVTEISSLDFQYADGTSVPYSVTDTSSSESDDDSDTLSVKDVTESVEKSVSGDIERWIDCWTNYLNLRRDYEQKMTSLLALEYQWQTMNDIYTVNDNPDNFVIY